MSWVLLDPHLAQVGPVAFGLECGQGPVIMITDRKEPMRDYENGGSSGLLQTNLSRKLLQGNGR